MKKEEKTEELVFCRLCHKSTEPAPGCVPLGWTVDLSQGDVKYLCRDCARRNLREIESKLGEEWWS